MHHPMFLRSSMSYPNASEDRKAQLLRLHERLLADDLLATYDIFEVAAPILERFLKYKFPDLAPGVDPNIYVSAVYDALTDYFKSPDKYDPDKSGLMAYLRLASYRDMQNLLRKESRHAKGRVSLEDVEHSHSDGNYDVLDEIADRIDVQRMKDELSEGMSVVERKVFLLMVEGERSTRAAAEVMGIGHLTPQEQSREVKRAKDRIKKRLQRSFNNEP